MPSELYVIPLDSSAICEHRFTEYFYDHQHIELPLATPEDLDEITRKNYFDFIEFLNTQKL